MKKSVRKITIVSVISAVAAFAVLGTTAAATGTLNPVFGQMTANEISDGTYSGGNVTAKSDTLNVDFEGVGGRRTKLEFFNVLAQEVKIGLFSVFPLFSFWKESQL